jgi:hypothetical protein
MESYQLINEKNLERFYKMLSAKKRNGFIIIEHNEKLPYAVLSKEKKEINHPFHLFLTMMTFGFWAIIWVYFIVSLSRKNDILVALDEDGNVFEEKCILK